MRIDLDQVTAVGRYLRYFVLFEDDGALVKKIAGYHQFHAVRAAISQVVAASRPGGTQRGGVVWHTQGSGKSITMHWRPTNRRCGV